MGHLHVFKCLHHFWPSGVDCWVDFNTVQSRGQGPWGLGPDTMTSKFSHENKSQGHGQSTHSLFKAHALTREQQLYHGV